MVHSIIAGVAAFLTLGLVGLVYCWGKVSLIRRRWPPIRWEWLALGISAVFTVVYFVVLGAFVALVM